MVKDINMDKVKLINNELYKLVFVIYKHRILNPNKKKKF